MIKRVRSSRDDETADDSWLKFKLRWLDALAQDHPTRGLAHDIAILLVRRYLFEDPGYAWISMDELAFEMDVARSSVLRAFGKLIDGGWLVCKRGGTGRGDSNRYYMPERIPLPGKRSVDASLNAKSVAPTHRKRSVGAPESVAPTHNKRSVHATRVRREESGRESEKVRPRALRRDSPSAPDFSSRVKQTLHGEQQSPRRAKRQPSDRSEAQQPRKHKDTSTRPKVSAFPDDWVLGHDEIAVAQGLTNWDLAKTDDEFAMFRTWMLDKGSTSANWPAAWEGWCRRGRKHEAKEQETKPLSGLQSEMLGYSTWLQNQKTKLH